MATILEKMRIRAPHTLLALNAPAGFEKLYGKLPAGINIVTDKKKAHNSIHWFIRSKAEVDKHAPSLLKMLQAGVVVWGYYPKSTSKIQTDLTRDKGWDTLLAHNEIKWLSLISVDDTWSAFAFRLKTDKEAMEAEEPQQKEIDQYADPKTKTITLPADLDKTLSKNKKAKSAFDALSYSNRREYVNWVISAKREETRKQRLDGSVEKLLAGKKNPTEK